MRYWFKELGTFVASLFRKWVPLMMGGALAASLTVWNYATGKPIPLHVGWAFISATFFAAAFLSWRAERRKAENNSIKVTPSFLVQLVQGKTSSHAGVITRPFIGKRITVTGVFRDASSVMFGRWRVTMLCEQTLILAGMGSWKVRSFIPIPKGEVITLTGIVTSVDTSAITISGIEIVPNPSTPISATPLLSEVPS